MTFGVARTTLVAPFHLFSRRAGQHGVGLEAWFQRGPSDKRTSGGQGVELFDDQENFLAIRLSQSPTCFLCELFHVCNLGKVRGIDNVLEDIIVHDHARAHVLQDCSPKMFRCFVEPEIVECPQEVHVSFIRLILAEARTGRLLRSNMRINRCKVHEEFRIAKLAADESDDEHTTQATAIKIRMALVVVRCLSWNCEHRDKCKCVRVLTELEIGKVDLRRFVEAENVGPRFRVDEVT